jgi:hypothetical protein
MNEPDDDPDPAREPVRLGDLFPDVTDQLAEVAARCRVDDRHTTDNGDET